MYTLIQNYIKNSETPTCFEPYRFIIRDYIKFETCSSFSVL